MPRDVTGGHVRNLFTLRQLENGIGREIVRPFVTALFDDIVAQMTRLDPTELARRSDRVRRLERMLDEISDLMGPQFTAVARELRKELALIGRQQAGFAAKQLQRAVGPSIDVGMGAAAGLALHKAVLDTDPIQGRHLKTWIKDLGDSTKRNLTQQIRIGFAENETIDQMVRRVRGRSAGKGRFTGGVMQTTTRHATAIVRTSVNHIANAGHMAVYEENADAIKFYEYSATLDSRTSNICISLDGRRWTDLESVRQPPLHVNCRSRIVPHPDFKRLGLDKPMEGTRASASGPVPASTRYPQWLRDQPTGTQNKVLGKAKAEMFRDGKLDLRQLVNRDGRSLTVAQLEAKAK